MKEQLYVIKMVQDNGHEFYNMLTCFTGVDGGDLLPICGCRLEEATHFTMEEGTYFMQHHTSGQRKMEMIPVPDGLKRDRKHIRKLQAMMNR